MEKYILAVCFIAIGCDDCDDCWEGSICVSDYADVPEEVSTGRFNITLVFGEGTPEWLKEAAHAAARRWEEILIGDLPDVTDAAIPQGECSNDMTFSGDIDDIVIFVSLDETLNPGVFGLGGSCWSRKGGLPFAGRVRINPEADYLVGQGTMGNLVAHEIGHALGFMGNRFESEGLISGGKYCGESALAQYAALGGSGCIALDKSGGHFTEAEFGEELMTNRLADIRGSRAPISTVTIGIMEDLGYEVNYSAADSFGL